MVSAQLLLKCGNDELRSNDWSQNESEDSPHADVDLEGEGLSVG